MEAVIPGKTEMAEEHTKWDTHSHWKLRGGEGEIVSFAEEFITQFIYVNVCISTLTGFFTVKSFYCLQFVIVNVW